MKAGSDLPLLKRFEQGAWFVGRLWAEMLVAQLPCSTQPNKNLRLAPNVCLLGPASGREASFTVKAGPQPPPTVIVLRPAPFRPKTGPIQRAGEVQSGSDSTWALTARFYFTRSVDRDGHFGPQPK